MVENSVQAITLGRVSRRPDQFLCSSDFFDLFSNVQYQHLNRATSDHAPLYLQCHSDVTTSTPSFRYLDAGQPMKIFIAL